MVKDQYAERIQAAQEAADKEVAALQKKINDIDKLMAKQAIDEQDENYNRKRNQLEQLIHYEVDEGNKYELQKELDRLNEEYEKRKQKEALDAQKSALQEEINNIKDRVNQEISELENLRDLEISQLESQFEAKKVLYEKETELREEELLKQQAAIAAYTALALNETQATVDEKKKKYENDTKNHKTQLNEQEKNIDAFRTSTVRKYEDTSQQIKGIGESTVTHILEYLNSMLGAFADAGWAAGSAYANAFQSAAASAISIANSSRSVGYAMTGNLFNSAARASSFASGMAVSVSVDANGMGINENQNNEVHIYQTITAPVASPSLVAREAKRELQQALRYS